MLFPQPVYLEKLVDLMKSPIRPKHIRLSAVLICINQFLIANILLFLVILAYVHIEEASSRAISDMYNQKDNSFYGISDLILNQLRFHVAYDFTMSYRIVALALVCFSAAYLFSAIGLLIGIYKNREEPVFIWLILQIAFLIGGVIFLFWIRNGEFVEHTFGKSFFYVISISLILCDIMMWYIIFCFYRSIRMMNKLREIATVAIPCPPPGTVPFQFRRENMYLGSNGYKHILTEAPDGNY